MRDVPRVQDLRASVRAADGLPRTGPEVVPDPTGPEGAALSAVLTELLKHTRDTHPDWVNLSTAHQNVSFSDRFCLEGIATWNLVSICHVYRLALRSQIFARHGPDGLESFDCCTAWEELVCLAVIPIASGKSRFVRESSADSSNSHGNLVPRLSDRPRG